MAEHEPPPHTVGLLGGGVIGGGWAARFLLHGTDVKLYDPQPDAERRVIELVANARRAYAKLTLAPRPAEGRLVTVATPQEAVTGVELVQESTPERVELKRSLFAELDRVADPTVIFASSTSGLLPSRLAVGMERPQRLTVAHPFNPVYLLPLVELCAGEHTAPETTARAAAIYRSVGMAPLIVRKEIDGFVADRLLEALWREALWLVNDDIATVEEIDDAIRLGGGLRWAFMGSFLTYRIAGGEAGMRHFMAQFGPALKWPWTKLMDVPELDEKLLQKLVEQSDAQADGRSVRELERIRDDCLVSVLQALRERGVGAGEVLRRHEQSLFDIPAAPANDGGVDTSRPLELHRAQVLPEWIDYNGHAHESRYLQVFGDASDALLRLAGVDAGYLAGHGSYFTVESHICHLRQASADQRLLVRSQVLAADDKRLHVFHSLVRTDDGELLATAEQMLLHVSAGDGRAGPAADPVRAAIRAIADAHAALPAPERAGRRVGVPR
jgi:carnitine 3-dehydrogenase / betainyl-CoA thioesterase